MYENAISMLSNRASIGIGLLREGRATEEHLRDTAKDGARFCQFAKESIETALGTRYFDEEHPLDGIATREELQANLALIEKLEPFFKDFDRDRIANTSAERLDAIQDEMYAISTVFYRASCKELKEKKNAHAWHLRQIA